MNTKYFYIKELFLLVLTLFFLTSCEDEVNIDIDPLKEQLVVDAWLTNKSEPQVIFLTKSLPYFENELPQKVEGATVLVTSNKGTSLEFIEEEPGNYVWTPATGENIGEIGTEYTLQISLNEAEYSAVSTLNRVPAIDSITYEYKEDEAFEADGIYTEFFARDFVGEGDRYWIKTFKNGMFLNKPDEINIAFDAGFTEGGGLDGLIFLPLIREATNRVPDPDTEDDEDVAPWKEGDVIRVEIHSINEAAYYFLSTAEIQMTNGNNGIFSQPVINTKGNIFSQNSEEALGMFNVAAVSELERLIQ